MANNGVLKMKMLALWEILRQDSDEEHPLSTNELCRKLNEKGIPCERKSIRTDMKQFRNYGFEVESKKVGRERVYYIEDRQFSVPELKILIDAVQAATFITERKSAEMVEKIAALGGSHRADILKSNIVHFNTNKHTNEAILYTVDSIEDAIARKKKVAFNYFHLDEKAERVYVTTPTGRKKRYYIEPER